MSTSLSISSLLKRQPYTNHPTLKKCNSLSLEKRIQSAALNARAMGSESQSQQGRITKPSVKQGVRVEDLEKTISAKFPEHPFSRGITFKNGERVMRSYFAMSQAFPYVQAGAYGNLALKAISRNKSIPVDVEKTFVVGSFLCWDETGGQWLLRNEGIAALPKVLDTRTHFHSNLLRNDLLKIFGKPLSPQYCPFTKDYLKELLTKLGSPSKLERGATMVAFEMHAKRMIESLWVSLANTYKIRDKSELIYFEAHVGEVDPGEAYHVDLTQKLIKGLVTSQESTRFLTFFDDAYAQNIRWCENICKNQE